MLDSANRTCDVVQDVFAVRLLFQDAELQTAAFFAATTQCLNLVSLAIVVETEGPTDSVLVKSLCRRIHERVGKNQIFEVEFE